MVETFTHLVTYVSLTCGNRKKHSVLDVNARWELSKLPTGSSVRISMTCMSTSCAIGGGSSTLAIT